jgi:hypothetical protein
MGKMALGVAVVQWLSQILLQIMLTVHQALVAMVEAVAVLQVRVLQTRITQYKGDRAALGAAAEVAALIS